MGMATALPVSQMDIARNTPVLLAAQAFPSGALIPENLLRFHLRFAQPVNMVQPGHCVRLRDSTGELIAHPFVDLPQGLWSADAATLTILMHPGRIKHGLRSSVELGLALRADASYYLEIDTHAFTHRTPSGCWQTVHRFNAGPAINAAIDLRGWEVASPPAFTADSLRVRFDRPLDYLSVQTSLLVRDSKGQILDCSITTAADEAQALLTPRANWLPGAYQLLIHPEIEDAAGNRIAHAFEAQIQARGEDAGAGTGYQLPFTVRARVNRGGRSAMDRSQHGFTQYP
jgi:hypothetical protein